MTQNQLTDIFGIEKHGLDHWTLGLFFGKCFGPIFWTNFFGLCFGPLLSYACALRVDLCTISCFTFPFVFTVNYY